MKKETEQRLEKMLSKILDDAATKEKIDSAQELETVKTALSALCKLRTLESMAHTHEDDEPLTFDKEERATLNKFMHGLGFKGSFI